MSALATMEAFEKLLNESLDSSTPKEGEVVNGSVIAIEAGQAIIDIGYKMEGRVGDSPIIGAGVYLDNEIGAACATGLGEAIIKICGSHTIVELMRNGLSPEQACKSAIDRIKKSMNLNGAEKEIISESSELEQEYKKEVKSSSND